MHFSHDWEVAFRNGEHDSRWPWSDLVSLFMRHASRVCKNGRLLEIGCGAGANIPFLQTTGAQYHAIEGSGSAAQKARQRFPALADDIVTGDFITEIPFSGLFDVVVDRAAMTHNNEQAIRSGIEKLSSCLRSGGIYIGIDWFSTRHSGFLLGEQAEDGWTRKDIANGPFANVGRVHFSDEAHLRALFAGWEWLALEEKQTCCLLPQPMLLSSWNFVLRKS